LPLFDGIVSTYSISLIDVIKEVDEDLLADHDLEFSGMRRNSAKLSLATILRPRSAVVAPAG
jgi:hypothetical protein